MIPNEELNSYVKVNPNGEVMMSNGWVPIIVTWPVQYWSVQYAWIWELHWWCDKNPSHLPSVVGDQKMKQEVNVASRLQNTLAMMCYAMNMES